MEKLKENLQNIFCGEMIVNKRDFWLVGGICFLAGVVYGLFMAPWTRGVSICSNNGNGNCYSSENDNADGDGEDCCKDGKEGK